MESTLNPSPAPRAWQPFAWIIATSALAHLWCLGSVFFLDDDMIIERNPVVTGGQFWTVGVNAWTYLWYVIQYRLFGVSAPGFHAVNWLLHTAVACMLFLLGRDLLRGRAPLALFAAVLFAVHPLGSEIPNYARTQDLAWVTLFSLFAAWRMFHLAQGGGWKDLLLVVLGVLGATFSKGPGILHGLMMVGAAGFAFIKPEYSGFLRRHRLSVIGTTVVLVLGLFALGRTNYGFDLSKFSEPRYVGHAYTIGRVFWEFAWRSVIPVSLSADHHIAETLVPAGAGFLAVPDQSAILATLAMLLLTGVGIFLAWKESTRVVGVCLFVYSATILFRVLYLVPEFMPEYRIYPGLPWFCLGAAVVLHAALLKFTEIPPRVPAMILIAVFTVLSANRSFVWHDRERLLADVLAQYPTQSRALWELAERDMADGKWQEIITRQRTEWPELFRRFLSENQRLAPSRELPTGHLALAEVACRGTYAVALAHTEGAPTGLREINQQELYMRGLGLDPLAHSIHWGYFFYNKALVLEVAGKDQEAIALLEKEGVPRIGKLALKRLKEKIVRKRAPPGR